MFPIIPNRLFSGGTKNNRHFRYPKMKITNFKLSGTRLGMTLHHCHLMLETETESGTKSRFQYLCLDAKLDYKQVEDFIRLIRIITSVARVIILKPTKSISGEFRPRRIVEPPSNQTQNEANLYIKRNKLYCRQYGEAKASRHHASKSDLSQSPAHHST